MVRFPLRWRLPAALVAAAWAASFNPALAQTSTTPPPERADPLDARAPVPAVVHPSSFSSYRRLGQDKPLPWRDANAEVGRIGGWKAYAREARQVEPAASATPPSGATP